MIPPNIFSGFAETGIYPWSPLAIPICAFLPHKTFQEGSKSTPTKRHPLAWVMDNISEGKARITLDAADNNVMSLLRSSINTSGPPTETPPTLYPDSGENSGVSVQNYEESVVEDDGSQNKTPEDQISPIIPLESGVTLGDLLEPEASQFLDENINDLMVQVGQGAGKSNTTETTVSVDPFIRLDGQTSECLPLTDAQCEKVVNEVFTSKIRGKVRLRGGIRGARGTVGKSLLSQAMPRLLTSDEIFNIKVEQEKTKEEKRKKAEERKQTKMMYHLKQLAKLQK